jgi:ketosteroid isomerase-like protein
MEWIAAANKKDAEALTNLYDENSILMPEEE